MSRRPFSWRSFTSLILAWTFLTLIVSGSILYVSPPGRIANWTQWRIGALTKAQWQGVHVLTAMLFLTGGLFHLLKFNWKVFAAYLKKRGDAGIRFGREIALSAAVFGMVVAATIANLPPFGTVMTAGEAIKESWGEPAQPPPVPHLEEQTMRDVAARLELQPDAAARLLDRKGIRVPADSGTRLKEVARQNRISPQELYAALQPAGSPARPADHGDPGSGSGLGQRTITTVARELGITPEAAISALAARDLKASPGEDLRTVAFRQGKRPFEVMEILQQSAAKPR